jgi:hypothetical protein
MPDQLLADGRRCRSGGHRRTDLFVDPWLTKV